MSKEQPLRRWTVEEDKLLREGFRMQLAAPGGKGCTINWNEIAKRIPDRSNKDCRKRYYNSMVTGLKKGSWTKEEDSKLRACIEECGLSWALIAQKMENRNADQCSKRWHHCLDPRLERQPWTEEENQQLRAAVATHGNSWKDIQVTHFPARSANNVKNQYTIISGRYRSTSSELSPCCPQIHTNSPEDPSDQSDACGIGEVSQNDSCEFMVSGTHAPTHELIDDWSTDFGSFPDDFTPSEFSDPWSLFRTNEMDNVFNSPPESVHAGHDLPYLTTNSSVADTGYEPAHENFDAHAQCLSGNSSATLDSSGYNSVFSQRNSPSIQNRQGQIWYAGTMRRTDPRSPL